METSSSSFCKFLLRREENVSPRPIQSIDTYLSLDAECIVAGSSDKHLRFLETDTLEEIADCSVSKRSVNCVAVSDMSVDGDDPVIITGGKDSSIQIWDPASGQMERTVTVPTPEVRSLDIYQGSETFVLIGTRDAKVILWDMRNDKLKWLFQGHRASIHSVSITSAVSDIEHENDLDFLCIASGGADRTVRTWDIKTGKKLMKFRHLRSISCMAVANKGIRPILATAGVERVIYLWDVGTGIMLSSLRGHLDQVTSLSLWEGFQTLLVTGSADHTIRIYDIVTGENICVLVGHSDSVLSTTICNFDNPRIVSSSEDLSLIQWDLDAVIKEFYFADADRLGARNTSVPPYVPVLDYQAPDELDKEKLSKDERKQLRKQMKKEKRKKASIQYRSAKGSVGEADREGLTSPLSVDSAGYDSDEMERELELLEDEFQSSVAAVEEEEETKQEAVPRPAELTTSTVAVAAAATTSIRRASVELIKSVLKSVRIGNNKVGLDPSFPVETALSTASNNTVAATAAVVSIQNRRPSFGSESQKARILANQLESKFNIAVVEQQLEHEKQKEQAKSKLATRLKKKKLQAPIGGTSAADEISTSASVQSTPLHKHSSNATVASAEKSSSVISKAVSLDSAASCCPDAAEQALLESTKREKLRQHKMQEVRRNNSMMIAKERSGLALQKRLDQMAAKRKEASALKEEDEDSESD